MRQECRAGLCPSETITTTILVVFILCLPPDENRRFDTIVGKNKRNALRAVRALRVVSNANNPSGAATMSSRAIYRDASGMPRRAVPERNYYDHHFGGFYFVSATG